MHLRRESDIARRAAGQVRGAPADDPADDNVTPA
jgi:hypothetical protein